MAEEVAGLLVKLSVNAESFAKELDQIEKKMEGFKQLGEKLQKTGLALSAMGGAVVASFGLMFRSYAKNADELSKLSQRTGIAVESLQELQYAAELCGSSLNSIIVATKFLSRAITEAKDGTAEYADTFESLGLKIEDIESLSPEQQFMKVAEAIASIQNPTERTARTLDVFGRSGTELIPLINKGSDGIAKLREEFSKYGTVIDTQTAQATEEFNDTLARVKVSLSGSFAVIGQQVLPIMQSFASSLSETALSIKNFTAQHKELVTTITKVVLVVASLTAGFGLLLASVGTFLVLAPTIAAAWTVITGPIGLTVLAIAGITTAIIAVAKNWDYLLLQMQKAWAVFVDIILAGTISILSAFNKIPFLSKQINSVINNLNQQRLENAKEIADKISAYEAEKANQTTKTQEQEYKKRTDTAIVSQETILEEMRKAEDAKINYQKAMFDQMSNSEKKTVLGNEKAIINERLKLAKIGTEAYYQILTQQYENQKALNELGNYEMITGYNNAISELENRTINYKDVIVGIYDNIQSGIGSAFNTLFTDLSNGFADFGAFATSVGNAIKGALIQAFAEIAAQWIMQHVIMKAATIAWKALEVSAAAAVGAARAAAAAAWSLWGAIAIGAAIGAAILKMAGAFETGGIVGGTSYTGDNIIARVNSGEMILNDSQQANLWKLANGQSTTSSGNVSIEQNFNISSGSDLEELTSAIRKGTSQALEFAGLTYKIGAKQSNVVV